MIFCFGILGLRVGKGDERFRVIFYMVEECVRGRDRYDVVKWFCYFYLEIVGGEILDLMVKGVCLNLLVSLNFLN